MTSELQKLQLNIKVADKLISQLSLVDGMGYDRMGEYAQEFLMDIADTGEIGSSHLEGYFRYFKETFRGLRWINTASQENAKTWLNLVGEYRLNRSEENAQALISF